MFQINSIISYFCNSSPLYIYISRFILGFLEQLIILCFIISQFIVYY